MRKFVLLIISILFSLIVFSQKDNQTKIVVIIDPGHGNRDPGAIVYLNKIPIIESTYAYDVSLRLEKILLEKGITVFKTTKDDDISINNDDTIKLYPKTLFNFDKTSVGNGIPKLTKRTSFANLKKKQYSDCRIIFISIHFDISRPSYFGARIIKGDNDTFHKYLKIELENEKLLSNSNVPVLNTGDKTNYIKHFYVLGHANKTSEKVILELGNLKSKKDLSRIVNNKVREDYASVIADAILKYMNLIKCNNN